MTTRSLLRDDWGSSAAEFAITLPLLMILLFGLIDVGRFVWLYNRAEKATQMGARMAVVTDYVAPGIATSYVGSGGLTQGDNIPASQFGKITCTATVGAGGATAATCACSTTPCPTVGTANVTAFDQVVTRMRLFMPQITAANVKIEYSSSGLGYAGNPVGPDLSPLVTVSLTGIQYAPLTGFLIARLPLPPFTATLTSEDLSGAVSN